MRIVIDANVLLADPGRKDQIWSDLRTLSAHHLVSAEVPTIVVHEVVEKWARDTAEDVRKLEQLTNRGPDRFREVASQAATARGEDAVDFETLRNSLIADRLKVIPTPKISLDDLALRAARRIRPFHDAGNGFRDTIHWLTVLSAARRGPEHTVWVSNDDGFATTKGSNILHPSLVEEAKTIGKGRGVTWVRSLHDVQLPSVEESGEYAVRRLLEWLPKELAGHPTPIDVSSLGVSPAFGLTATPTQLLALIVDDVELRPYGERLYKFTMTANAFVNRMGVWENGFSYFVRNPIVPFKFSGSVSEADYGEGDELIGLRFENATPSDSWARDFWESARADAW
ncbi:MAG: PIN domain-containing protein [Leifsonia sp.]